jgi:competence ComEA-like helix-hairpin-helix protein
MKKASYVLFAFTGLFFALVIGIFIGRNSVSGMIILPENKVEPFTTNVQVIQQDEAVLAPSTAESGKININTASVSLLQTLPNIGSVLAQRIVDFRNENGNFTVPEDLLQVEGIGEKRLEEIRNYITVGG